MISQLLQRDNRERVRIINHIGIFKIYLFDWSINSVRPESLFDSGPFILLLLVSNNGIILS